MKTFTAAMIDECGDPFTVEIQAESVDAAWEQAEESYPESRIEEVYTGSGDSLSIRYGYDLY